MPGADGEDGGPAQEAGRRRRRSGKTTPPPAPERTGDAAEAAASLELDAAVALEHPRVRPAIDIEVARIGGPVSPFDGPWRAFEVWTRNRIYGLDGGLLCIAVYDRATGRLEPDHPFHGAHLVGGQVRVGDVTEVWQPLPVPGAEAVFEHTRGGHNLLSHTSVVERIVVRLRGLSTSHSHLISAWNGVVTGRED